jgi:hypothetical protein
VAVSRFTYCRHDRISYRLLLLLQMHQSSSPRLQQLSVLGLSFVACRIVNEVDVRRAFHLQQPW